VLPVITTRDQQLWALLPATSVSPRIKYTPNTHRSLSSNFSLSSLLPHPQPPSTPSHSPALPTSAARTRCRVPWVLTSSWFPLRLALCPFRVRHRSHLRLAPTGFAPRHCPVRFSNHQVSNSCAGSPNSIPVSLESFQRTPSSRRV